MTLTQPKWCTRSTSMNSSLRLYSSRLLPLSSWQVISDTTFKFSAPLNVGGSLFAVGGYDYRGNPSSSIHLYQPDTRRWVNVGDLPTARYFCICSVLPNEEVIVAGGHNGRSRISAVDFLSISNTY